MLILIDIFICTQGTSTCKEMYMYIWQVDFLTIYSSVDPFHTLHCSFV